jgi:hypothetical protein
MSIALPFALARPAPARSVAKIALSVLAILVFALVVVTVAFVRTFAFEYFHGNPAALRGLMQLILGN